MLGRGFILRVHAKNKPLAKNVDLKWRFAQQTPGFVGADLENVLNEAALVAARRNKKVIDADDIDEADREWSQDLLRKIKRCLNTIVK